jgi:F0F1-type ATP synthase assembly protein I
MTGGPDSGKPAQKPVSGADVAGLGVAFAAILVAFSFAGIWLDDKLGTSPWLTIVMVFLGAAGAFYSMYHKLMKGQRLGDRRQGQERRGDEG